MAGDWEGPKIGDPNDGGASALTSAKAVLTDVPSDPLERAIYWAARGMSITHREAKLLGDEILRLRARFASYNPCIEGTCTCPAGYCV